jgi:gliding motility-associated-like protein
MKQLYLCLAILLFFSANSFAQAVFNPPGILCQGVELTFVDLSPSSDIREWDFDDDNNNSSTDSVATHTYQNSGTYNVTLTITIGVNSFSVTHPIYISLKPTAYFWVDTASVSYSSYTRLFIDTSIFPNPAKKYYWDFGDGNKYSSDTTVFAYKYRESGTYTVLHKVTDVNNCTDSINEDIVISDVFMVPNVFTPNNDLINDQFIVTSNGVTLFTIDIYSRWGNRVFSRSGTEQIAWDGRLPNGTMVKPGTYFYVITPQSGSVTYEPETGYVTVFY